MKYGLRALVIFAVGLFVACAPAFAHHGSSASYDLKKVDTLTGTVTKFIWSNPHSQIYFDVTDAKGDVIHWGGAMTSPFYLVRFGWTPTSLKPGDKITINVCPSKFGTPVGLVGKVVLPDGKVLQANQVLLHTPASQ